MRKLELQDVFKLSEIIDVMGIEIDLKDLMDKVKKDGKVTERVGGQIALLFVKKLHKAEKQVYKFIADLTGETIEEVKKYRPKKLIDLFVELLNDEDFADFFQQG
jgi:Mor family transcriptional regulator